MASSKLKPRSKPSQPIPPSSSRYPPRPPASPPEVIDPRWLVKALSLTVLAAIVCAYLATCLLIYQGSWQLILHPTAKIDITPAVPFQPIRFDAAETGAPRLTAWWIPADPQAPNTRTLLYLHDGTGSLSAAVPSLNLLHRAGVNLLAIDYRGFGQSLATRPSEARMAEDASAALDYLESSRHLPAATIIPYGEGLGAVLAVNLVNAHPDLPALIIDNPDPHAFENAYGSGKTRLLPMHLLASNRFDLKAALGSSTRPKLLLANSPSGSALTHLNANQSFFRTLPDPKLTVTFSHPGPDTDSAYLQSVTRFLDEYVPTR